MLNHSLLQLLKGEIFKNTYFEEHFQTTGAVSLTYTPPTFQRMEEQGMNSIFFYDETSSHSL